VFVAETIYITVHRDYDAPRSKGDDLGRTAFWVPPRKSSLFIYIHIKLSKDVTWIPNYGAHCSKEPSL
jgi:hypothetical protein